MIYIRAFYTYAIIYNNKKYICIYFKKLAFLIIDKSQKLNSEQYFVIT